MKMMLMILAASLWLTNAAFALTCDSERFVVEVRSYETETQFVQWVAVGCNGSASTFFSAYHPIVDGEVQLDTARSLRFRTLAATALAMLALPDGYQVRFGTFTDPGTGAELLHSISSRRYP
jgi:hypothetical protein